MFAHARNRKPSILRVAPLLASVLVASTALLPRRAAAQSNDLAGETFAIDLVTGPVLGTHGDVGMGGARTALAVGSDGTAFNPASYASRGLWEVDWFSWDLAFDLIPGTLHNTDFDNNGSTGFTYSDFFFVTVGGGLRFGALGVGGLFRVQTYNVGSESDLTLAVGNYGISYAFFDGDVVIGLGARTAALSISTIGTAQSLVDFNGTSPEAGLLLRPEHLPVRIGLAMRAPVVSKRPSDAVNVAGLTMPSEIKLPWEMQAGVALQLGKRPLNQKWENPHDLRDALRAELRSARAQRMRAQAAREAAANDVGETIAHVHVEPTDPKWWRAEQLRRAEEDEALRTQVAEATDARAQEIEALPRDHWLFSTDLIIVGPNENAVGLESFLSQQRQASGQDISIGLRGGLETEPIDNRLKMRVGGYFEPSRFANVGYRIHGTAGGEVRLFRWDFFGLFDPFDLRVGLTFDVAKKYLNWTFGFGFWH